MIEDLLIMRPSSTSDNTEYTLWLRLAFRDIAHRKMQNAQMQKIKNG
jgi:hypothetical protein